MQQYNLASSQVTRIRKKSHDFKDFLEPILFNTTTICHVTPNATMYPLQVLCIIVKSLYMHATHATLHVGMAVLPSCWNSIDCQTRTRGSLIANISLFYNAMRWRSRIFWMYCMMKGLIEGDFVLL